MKMNIIVVRILSTIQILIGLSCTGIIVCEPRLINDVPQNIKLLLYASLYINIFTGILGWMAKQVNSNNTCSTLITILFYFSNSVYLIFALVKSVYSLAFITDFTGDHRLMLKLVFFCGILECLLSVAVIACYEFYRRGSLAEEAVVAERRTPSSTARTQEGIRITITRGRSEDRMSVAEGGGTFVLDVPPLYDDIVTEGVWTIYSEGLPSYSDIVKQTWL